MSLFNKLFGKDPEGGNSQHPETPAQPAEAETVTVTRQAARRTLTTEPQVSGGATNRTGSGIKVTGVARPDQFDSAATVPPPTTTPDATSGVPPDTNWATAVPDDDAETDQHSPFAAGPLEQSAKPKPIATACTKRSVAGK
ncbi:hypothetical protein IPJ72_06605 [Candidatus Peregrinibacteria bacterium]|nr:MAG: hypothetical protein IPJ72_06605 [Candidatus Peregrinibacteria bacterium]